MISDEQRREAAASLRGSRGFFNSLPRTVLEPFIFDIFERVLECVGYTEGNVFDYLADLVDRGEARTSTTGASRTRATTASCARSAAARSRTRSTTA